MKTAIGLVKLLSPILSLGVIFVTLIIVLMGLGSCAGPRTCPTYAKREMEKPVRESEGYTHYKRGNAWYAE